VSYSVQGTQGLKKEGGTGRKELVEKLAAEMGGTIEAFYFAFGDDDVYVIADLPDNTNAAAVALAVGSSGAVNIKTTVLLTPEEVDRASKISVAYRPPGK